MKPELTPADRDALLNVAAFVLLLIAIISGLALHAAATLKERRERRKERARIEKITERLNKK